MKTIIFISAYLLIAHTTFSQPILDVALFSDGYTAPLGLVNCNDDRIFVICQDGYVYITDSLGNTLTEPYLNIDERVESDYNAHGLLGLVFHPDYAVNGYFYVNYINNDGNTVISRFTVSGDENIADTSTEEILLIVEQPYIVHKGGDLQFGPDGYLYFPLGDGGYIDPLIGDPDNRAQNPQMYLGKMMRIDVNGVLPYEIPVTNPFYSSADTLPEIWAIGLRNLWRFSFDRLTGDMYMADVGQELFEELDVEPFGFVGGANYGWRCYESNAAYNFDSCDETTDFTFPVFEYPHNDSTGGYSITGGYVYRGTDFPGLYGYYICGDYLSKNFWAIKKNDSGIWENYRTPDVLYGVVSFGEDKNGELYCVVRETGEVFRVIDKCAGFENSILTQNATCGTENNGSIDINVEGGIVPYTYEWSNGATTEDINELTAGTYTVSITDSVGCIITDSAEILLDGLFEVIITAIENTLQTAAVGVSYVWYLNGEIIAGATEASYFVTESGDYNVEVTDANNCTIMSDSYGFFFIGIFDAEQNEIVLYPGITGSVLHIVSPIQFINGTLQIFNTSGILVYADILSRDREEIDVSQYPDGMYRITLVKNEQMTTGTFMVVK